MSDPSRPGRLLLVTQLPPPYGGLTVHSQRLAAEARRRGWRVTVLDPAALPDPLPRRLRRTRLLLHQLATLVRLLLVPADVVHDHVSSYGIGASERAAAWLHVATLLALRTRRGPWILSCGNGLLPGILARTSERERRRLRWLYAPVRAAIAKNEPILEAFRELGLGDRARVVGTFLEPVARPGRRALAPEVERFLAGHERAIATAGFRFEPLYRVHDVVRAVAALRRRGGAGAGAGLIVLGSRDEDARGGPLFAEAMRETGLDEHVLVLRDVDDALDVIARCAIFVRATDFDGDANTVKEAMMVGVPVLATDLPNRPPGLELIPKGAMDELPDRLEKMLAAPDADRVARNRRFVEEDIARNGGTIFSLYDEARR